MHNYEAFFEEQAKKGHIVSTLSILSCWILGLIQAVPLMSTWNQSCKISNLLRGADTETNICPLKTLNCSAFGHFWVIFCTDISIISVTFCNSNWNNQTVSDFTSCSLPYLSANWIWTVACTVFIIPTIIIIVSYSLIIRKLYQESTEASEAYQVTFVMISPS